MNQFNLNLIEPCNNEDDNRRWKYIEHLMEEHEEEIRILKKKLIDQDNIIKNLLCRS